jgi:sugar lactone lactonase YvrE
MRILRILLAGALALTALTLSGAGCEPPSYINFETIPTRAVALSPDGLRLFVTNTPDARLEIFDVTADGLVHRAAVTVGLEPVAVAARSNTEVWVVNHLSDSVSVVKLGPQGFSVDRTLLVGDEPRDVVFAGPPAPGGRQRAFVTAARRGQNHPANTLAEQQVPGFRAADVWVFDAENLGAGLGGTPITIVTLFGDKPGALEATPDGSRVFVSIATSGNETTIIPAGIVCDTDAPCLRTVPGPMPGTTRQITAPGGIAEPRTNSADGAEAPKTGLIVKFDRTRSQWLDVKGRDWTPFVFFNLPDADVFTINANASPPAANGVFQHTGTLNEGIAIHPSGRAYLATTEAINTNRFISLPTMGAFPNPSPAQGVARTADPATGRTLNGHLYESRIAILGTTGSVTVRHLNPHIDYEVVPSPAGVKERSVSSPRGGVFSADGSTLFVVAMGSNKIVPFQTADLDSGNIQPDASTHIPLSGVGPTSAVLDARLNRLYVYSRLDNAVEEVDLTTRREIRRTPLFSAELPQLQAGRRFFYDSTLTSSNGEANCSVCHPSGDKDDLAWDLGAPFLPVTANTNPFVRVGNNIRLGPPNPLFSPLKGPMTVLTLRGIVDGGPLFWRGDATNTENVRDFTRNFTGFNVVFPALLGNDAQLGAGDFNLFTLWASSIATPPNPHRMLNNDLTPDQRIGMDMFLNRPTDVPGPGGPNVRTTPCVGCHRLDPGQGFFGTGGENTAEGETQEFKVVQLRTVYDKVGMFGVNTGITNNTPVANRPPVIRGFGTLHDGALAGPETFINAAFPLFFGNDPNNPTNNAALVTARRQVAEFMLTFPAEYAPIVGQQVTLRGDSPPTVDGRIDLMRARAMTPFVLQFTNENVKECDLIVKGPLEGKERGFLMQPDGTYMDDRGRIVADSTLRIVARGFGIPLTYTCVYPGAGRRLAFDRNSNGMPDGLE